MCPLISQVSRKKSWRLYECVKRGNLILRDELRDFEGNLAAFVGTGYAVGVNSGSDALHLTLGRSV